MLQLPRRLEAIHFSKYVKKQSLQSMVEGWREFAISFLNMYNDNASIAIASWELHTHLEQQNDTARAERKRWLNHLKFSHRTPQLSPNQKAKKRK